jgi:peptidoglycan/LPS O-acetylase OafA/YrhL
MSALAYRPEIDGLRALAVLPVIFFHAGFNLFGGGYVGVDVFFVISGYLITSIIISQKDNDNFSLLNFYERRARRILPALFLVIAACIPFAWTSLLPSYFKDFSQSLVAVSAFASNILFWMEGGYWDSAAELKPLLHTWSLSVEEQFYVLFPLLLILTWRLGRVWLVSLLTGILFISLAATHWGAFNAPEASFYLLPTRCWELLVGSLLAFYCQSNNAPPFNPTTNQLASLLGISLILYSVFTFSWKTPHPSLYTLVPTIGAALVILFATPQTIAGKILSCKAAVGLGLISYSAYLWHQPLFAFARLRSIEEPTTTVFFLLVMATIALSYLSWKFIEKPFRKPGFISRSQVFAFAALGTLLFTSIGLAGHLNHGFRERFPQGPAWDAISGVSWKKNLRCDPKPHGDLVGVLIACEFGDLDSKETILIYGDSHAAVMLEELNIHLKLLNLKGVLLQLDGCLAVPQVYAQSTVSDPKQCEMKFQNLLTYIKNSGAKKLIVSRRWTLNLYPIPGEIDSLGFVNSDGGKERRRYDEYFAISSTNTETTEAKKKKAAIQHLLDGFLSTGLKIYLIYPVPEIGWDVPLFNMSHYIQFGNIPDQISISHSDFIQRNRFIHNIFSEYEKNINIVPIKPESIFCNTIIRNRCAAQHGGQTFYFDDDHLSDTGVQFLIKKIFTTGLTN